MSYAAIVSTITVTKHPNADRLLCGTAAGHGVIVSVETQNGDVGLLFPPDGQLSEAYASANDLVGYTDPATGQRVGGFFDEKRRVRALRLRGVKSEGFWMPLSSVAFTGVDLSTLNVGDEVTTLNGVEICTKYLTKATRAAMARGEKVRSSRSSTKYFPRHFETTQFRFVKDFMFKDGGIVYISEKVHGTSQRTGYVLDDVPLPWWQRVVNYVNRRAVFSTKDYTYLTGTRNVILRDGRQGGFYGDDAFRGKAASLFADKLHKGEMVFYEIVGDVAPGTPIMPSAQVEDKELKKTYGGLMRYRYGCADGEHKVFVYRITMTNVDGVVTELSWPQVVKRCVELGVTPVPTIATFAISSDGAELATAVVENETDGPSTLDPTHIREGVVVRLENERGMTVAKNKSFAFKILEGLIKADDTAVDIEEAS